MTNQEETMPEDLMSDATEIALWKLSKGHPQAAQERLKELSEKKLVKEYLELTDRLNDAKVARNPTPPAESA